MSIIYIYVYEILFIHAYIYTYKYIYINIIFYMIYLPLSPSITSPPKASIIYNIYCGLEYMLFIDINYFVRITLFSQIVCILENIYFS